MSEVSCIFCKIIQMTVPAKRILETDLTLVIADIHPRAPIHYLVLPKKHIEHMGYIQQSDLDILADMAYVVQQLSLSLAQPAAFNVMVNNGAGAGQVVPHLHWHFLAGKNIYSSDFQL